MTTPSRLLWELSYASAFAAAGERLGRLHSAMAAALTVDASGGIAIDQPAVDAALAQFSADPRLRESIARHLEEIATDGAAILPAGELGGSPSIPWATFDFWWETHPGVASSLLLEPALAGAQVRPHEVRELLRASYPRIPDRFVTPGRAGAMARATNRMRRDAPDDGGDGGWTGGGQPGGGAGGMGPGTSDPLTEFARCFTDGDWSINVWGFSVCVNRECALKILAVLREYDAIVLWGTPFDHGPLWLLLATKLGGATAGAVLLILAIYAGFLQWNIEWTMNDRGVCIGANWPTPILGTFVFAYPG